MMAEQCKALSIEQFEQGTLTAKGPTFSVNYLELPEHKEKLRSLLREYSGVQDWRVALTGGGSISRPESGSILEAQRKQEAEKKRDIVNHPSVQNIKKVFPGSKIEGVQMRTRGKE
jgi:hypothetical protein